MRVLLLVGLCSLLVQPAAEAGPPPPEPRNMPGDVKGRVGGAVGQADISRKTRTIITYLPCPRPLSAGRHRKLLPNDKTP
jgi:hypothetical protein